MGTARNWINELSHRLELPADVLAGVPKMELIGTDLFRMEPHKGLLEYDTSQIRIASTIGIVCVIGSELRIKQMNYSQITIIGHIRVLKVGNNSDE